ncbi:MAG: TonB-dependent receptor [Flavobacteriales bacterium]
MKQFYITSLILITGISCLCQNSYHSISGSIRDAETGEELIGALVRVDSLMISTSTNVYGFYSLQVPEGNHEVKFSFVGYAEASSQMAVTEDHRIDLDLKPKAASLGGVTITGEKADAALDNVQMSVQKMDIQQIKEIPAFMGEVDVIRAVQMLPGVQTMGEGSTGMYVRGGGADENLILLDEAPVYNAAHLLGIFSTFNSDAIKDVQLYKGAIPASYGGRLSSVLDVRMKEGNSKKFSMQGGIGTVSSRLTVEAPLAKDKGSFMIAGRRTYIDAYLLFTNNEDTKDDRAYFYDLNAKANYRLGKNDRVFLSGYFGRDLFGDDSDDGFNLNWGNATGTLRWNHIYGSRLFSNLTVFYSNYDYFLGTESDDGISWTSSIKNLSGKLDYHFSAGPKSQMKFGLQTIKYTLEPGILKPSGSESFITGLKLEDDLALEHGIYFSHNYKFNDKLSVDYGLRFSAFQNLGPGTVYNYNDDFEVVDTMMYKKGKVYKEFGGLEPRVGVRYRINDKSSIKAGYNRMYQYIHLASNGSSVTPFDIYFPSGPAVRPRSVDQFSAGYFRNMKDNQYEASVEVYYKDMKNKLDFKDHAQLFLNNQLEGELRFGDGYSMGLELFVRKNEGRFKGFLSYTLSSSLQTINEVNGGREYRAKQDRLHDFALVGSYDLNERWKFGANFILQSGRAITAPSGRFDYGGTIVPVYSDRNAARMPAYHRFDLSATLQGKKNPNRKWQSEWVFSIYNVYSRKNAFSIAFVRNDEDKPVARKTYLFPIIPAVTYNFKF